MMCLPFTEREERNRAGQTLEEFLESYDPYKYKNPSCTTDAVVFSANGKVDEELTGLKILLVKRSNHPSIGFWALPGGFVELRENLEDTARRRTGRGNRSERPAGGTVRVLRGL